MDCEENMRKALIWIVIIAAVLAVWVLWEAHRSSSTLITTHYEVFEPIRNGIRVAVLSDLHNHTFGDGNEELIQAISSEKPDLIFMIGDMLNEDEKDTSVMTECIRRCAEIAPVYFSYGNHEKQWEVTYKRSISAIAEQAGAKVLDLSYQDVTVNGEKLRVAGYYGWYRATIAISDPIRRKQEADFFDSYEDTDRMKLLLCHVPVAFLDWEHRDEYEAGLAFCGHYHGGQIRLPFVGGLRAPNVGFFPKYTKGLFEGKGTDVILTTGLGNNHKVPRLNNPGELVIVDLKPETKESGK